MNFWTPQTGNKDDRWIYQYNAKTIQGFRCTHQPSPWMGDYGAFNIMPVVGELTVDGDKRASEFNHVNEISTPYYYQVHLDRYNVIGEMAPTTRGAVMKFTFPESESSYIVVDGLSGGSYIRIIPQQRRIIGYTKNHHGPVPKGFAMYFIMEFDKNFTSYSTWNSDTLRSLSREIRGDHAGVAFRFQDRKK